MAGALMAGALMIRSAGPGDITSFTPIYNHYVENTVVSFETETVSNAVMVTRLRAITDAGLPWLVAEQEGEVVGYAYASLWKVRQAYRFSVETSVYLAPARTGQGWGRRLYEALLHQLADQGVHAAMGGIVLPNQTSVALHESLGMRKVAHFEQVGYKFDRWVDVGYWQIILNSDSQVR